jgi:hypothetical protein
VLQRFGSSCELDLHFHTVRPDGVFTVDRAGGLTFHRLPAPERHELDRLVQEITAAVKRLLVRRGLWEDDGDGGQPAEDAGDEPMADLFAASVQNRLGTGPRPGGRLRRIRSAAPRPPRDGIKTRVAGFDLHVSSRIGKKRRDRREQLLRYLLRPPLSTDRLSLENDGTVLLALKTPWSDGTTYLRLTPVELLARLATLVCRPRTNQVLYTGVWSAHHRWRRAVTALGRNDDEDILQRGAEDATPPGTTAPLRPNPTWAELMRRGLQVDPLQCPSCGDRLAHVANILDRDTIRRILRHLGLRADPPDFAPARTPHPALALGA